MPYHKYVPLYLVGICLTLLWAMCGYHIFHRYHAFSFLASRKSYFAILLIISSVWVIIFALMKDLTVLSHHSYFDFAVFLEYYHKYAQGYGFTSSIQEAAMPGSAHWFSNHFTPVIYVFAFAYKIIPSFRTVDWLQTLAMATSPAILYLLSRRFLGRFSAFCVSLALLLNPTFQYITLYEFDFLRFVIPLGILALGLTLRSYPVPFVFLSCLAVLLTREDAALFIFGVGLFILLFQRGRRCAGAALIIMSVTYLIIVLKVIIPSFRGIGMNSYIAIGYFQDFGKTVPDIVRNILLNPANVLAHLLHPFKLYNWVMYILPFSFVSLAGASVLVVMVPSLAVLSFSNSVTHTSYFLYYVSPILVVVAWSTVIGISRLARFAHNKERSNKWLGCCPPSVQRISFAVLIGSIACSIYFGPSPISIQFWFSNFSLAPFRTTTFYIKRYEPTSHDEIVRSVSCMIPRNASVSAEQFLLVDIYRSSKIRVFPWIEDVDYVFLDKTNPRKMGSGLPGIGDALRNNPQLYYDWVEKCPDVFERVYSQDGVFLYKRKPNAPPYPQPREAPS